MRKFVEEMDEIFGSHPHSLRRFRGILKYFPMKCSFEEAVRILGESKYFDDLSEIPEALVFVFRTPGGYLPRHYYSGLFLTLGVNKHTGITMLMQAGTKDTSHRKDLKPDVPPVPDFHRISFYRTVNPDGTIPMHRIIAPRRAVWMPRT